MVDDARHGRRDARGGWIPARPVEYPAVFVWPPRPRALPRWLLGLPGYLFPWNAFYALVALASWLWLTPSAETLRTLEPGWILLLVLRNSTLTLLFFGAFHLRLYVRRAQGIAYKFDPRWPSQGSRAFLFADQTLDNLVWTFASGVPIWTAYEVFTLWAWANGWILGLDPAAHPVWTAAVLLAIPLLREVHFYAVHRLLHWPPLYRLAHRVHHLNTNPGPWSGLAMHPVEHLFYFSGVLFHWILPSHPVHALFHLVHAGLSPAPGHVGFDRLVLSDDRTFELPCWAHWLHHRYFECNYADGTIPLDRWLGTFHDGTVEGQRALEARLARRRTARATGAGPARTGGGSRSAPRGSTPSKRTA